MRTGSINKVESDSIYGTVPVYRKYNRLSVSQWLFVNH